MTIFRNGDETRYRTTSSALIASSVPRQWKQAIVWYRYITYAEYANTKISVPLEHRLPSNFHNICAVESSWTTCCWIVSGFLYSPSLSNCLWRSDGLTNSHSASLLVQQLLSCCTHCYSSYRHQPYHFFAMIALHFSKASDTVRHSTLLHKMACRLIFKDHQHCVKYNNETSAINPASYVVNASDMKTVTCHTWQLTVQIRGRHFHTGK